MLPYSQEALLLMKDLAVLHVLVVETCGSGTKSPTFPTNEPAIPLTTGREPALTPSGEPDNINPPDLGTRPRLAPSSACWLPAAADKQGSGVSGALALCHRALDAHGAASSPTAGVWPVAREASRLRRSPLAAGQARQTRVADPASPLLAHGRSDIPTPPPLPPPAHSPPCAPASRSRLARRRPSPPARGQTGVVAPRPRPVRPGGANGQPGFAAPRLRLVQHRRCLPATCPVPLLLAHSRPGGGCRSPPAAAVAPARGLPSGVVGAAAPRPRLTQSRSSSRTGRAQCCCYDSPPARAAI
ncbi:hypothetical protein PVAP13_1KG201005 [Panicum virgatum]|uniref:Uncharacterized protein n=1 Tax=Panicum virgatum TaxID=38727 RepID=A0A8T0XIL5_PANVG|nr:hypothetical protein PVAP13_1KG201005 [Panicum virgatum]